ncbi:MAG: hypothetical protein IT497_07670 [Ottowia sp.]|nr:hypothetical protein [Ottowia sp.]
MLNSTIQQKKIDLRADSETAWHTLAQAIAESADKISESSPVTPLSAEEVGELTIIGSGIETVGFSLGDEALIRAADAVFYCVADPATVIWIKDIRPDAYDLYVLYDDHKVRYTTYMQMSEAMLYHVRQGKKVVAIYYGHPGVFVLSTHRSIQIARREGHLATMRAGVCALDCLCADLGVDPCHPGLQTHEATDMLIRQRKPDTGLHVVLWQVGLIGEMGFRRKGYINSNFSVLIDYLQSFYGKDYPITHYVASRYPTIPPLIETLPLSALHDPTTQLKVTGISTFYLSPKETVEADPVMLQRLGLLKAGETLKPASGPLREIGRYGPRERKAFQAYGKFKVPRDYHWQEDVAASRFLIQLRQDLALQDLYRRDPIKAVSAEIFPGLSAREQSLLATRDAGAIQIAAKGSAKRSVENQHFLRHILSRRPLATGLLQCARHGKTNSDALSVWAKSKGYPLDIDNMRSDIDLLQREQLLPWSGVYFNPQNQQIITLLASPSGVRSSGLFIDAKQIKGFRFGRGVLQWEARRGRYTHGFLRLDVDRNGQRRLLGTIWSDAMDKSSANAMIWHEIDPMRHHPSRCVGHYRQALVDNHHVLKLTCAYNAEQGRHLQASLDDKRLPGPISFNGRSLIVGEQHFELALGNLKSTQAWHAHAAIAEIFGGRYALRLVKEAEQPTLQLDINTQGIFINGSQVTVSFPTPHRLHWQNGPERAQSGELYLLLDPITLLPEAFGTVHMSADHCVSCHGMVMASDRMLAERPMPEFDLPLPAWQALLTLSANASRGGGLFLWHKWEKAQYAAHIITTHLRHMVR